MIWELPQHSYEEIRETVVDILTGRTHVAYPPTQWGNLTTDVAEVFSRHDRLTSPPAQFSYGQQNLHPNDAELVRDVFWDLFRQGVITLGLNDSNPNWPWFRLSHFGKNILGSQNPYRFHDTSSFISLIRKEVPDISSDAVVYLEEAVAAFYSGCFLATCVMIGVAAEAEFLRLLDIASSSPNYGTTFAAVKKETFIRTKIKKFEITLKPLLPRLQPKKDFEDLDTNLTAIQSVLRIARNDAGHPSGASVPGREQVYVFLQLFVPFARQLMKLRSALS